MLAAPLPPPSGFPAKLKNRPSGGALPTWAVPKLADDNAAAVWIEDDPSRAAVLQP